MATRFDNHPNKGLEYNVYADAESAKIVFENWNTRFILRPFEVGGKVLTGIALIHNDSIQSSPVKDAYTISLEYDKNTKGQTSFDQTAVLVATRGIEPYFESRMLNLKIEDNVTKIIVPGERIEYLSLRQLPEEIAKTIEALMAH